jgi:hypothetical protein
VPVPLDAVRLYRPSTRPGHPLPHAWVERSCGRLALRSLVHDGHFALIAGEEGPPWVRAATKIAEERGIPLRAARVGIGDGVDLVDVRLAWLKQREISQEGAVRVRPMDSSGSDQRPRSTTRWPPLHLPLTRCWAPPPCRAAPQTWHSLDAVTGRPGVPAAMDERLTPRTAPRSSSPAGFG